MNLLTVLKLKTTRNKMRQYFCLIVLLISVFIILYNYMLSFRNFKKVSKTIPIFNAEFHNNVSSSILNPFINTKIDLTTFFLPNAIQNDSKLRFTPLALAAQDTTNFLPTKYNTPIFPIGKLKFIPNYSVTNINCASIFNNDYTSIQIAKKYSNVNANIRQTRYYRNLLSDCKNFIVSRQYIMEPLSQDENDFPLAYSLLIYKDFIQFERLLRAIYQPQNLYCIHYDKKSKPEFKNMVKNLVSCFSNVFLTLREIDVNWGTYTVLEPDLQCMLELYNRSQKWKYFINLTGQEFPLKTNAEIVRILKLLQGSNNMEGTIKRSNMNLDPKTLPHHFRITKGSVHILATRAFVKYVLFSSVAKELLNVCINKSFIPDECFFSSLNHNPQLNIPGAYKGIPETDKDKNFFIARFKNWGDYPFDYECSGHRVRQICILAAGDLPLLNKRPELFANKFYVDYQPLTLDCLEERHFDRMRLEVVGQLPFDENFYSNLSYTKDHVSSDIEIEYHDIGNIADLLINKVNQVSS